MKKVKVVLRYGTETFVTAVIDVPAETLKDGHSVVGLKNLLEGNAKVCEVKYERKTWKF